jgi:hypothetical protein
MSKSGSAKSHPVEAQAYRSSEKISQNRRLLLSSSSHVAGAGMMLVRVRVEAGALVEKLFPFESFSLVKPRCTAERVSSANMPHDDGP